MTTFITLRAGLTLEAEAAASWARAEAENGAPFDVNRSLVDWDTQYQLWLDYTHGRSPVIALHPDESNHCAGLAVDSDDGYDPRAIAILARHGWIQTVWRVVAGVRKLIEPWHFDRDPSKDRHLGTGFPAGVTARPFTTPTFQGGPTMFLFNGVSKPTQYYIGVYDGRTLKVRPTLGIEAKVLLNAQPPIARAQVTDAELVDLCAQGGYVYGKPYTN